MDEVATRSESYSKINDESLDKVKGRFVCARKANPENEFKVQISVIDHPTEAEKLRKFLEYMWGQKEKLNGEPCVYNAYIDTYRRFLQLKARYPDIRLYPSDEIEWVWYCHVVRPKFYIAYCEHNFQKLILHELDDWIAAHNNPALLQDTATLFEKEYPGEKFLFNELPLIESKEIKYLETADIYNDWNWYDHIMRLDGYPSAAFMKEGQEGYHHFLRTIWEDGFRLGPPINIDLWWHAHQIFPQVYIDDCMAMFGEVIYHTPLGTVGRWQEFPSHLTKDTKKPTIAEAKEEDFDDNHKQKKSEANEEPMSCP